MSTADQILSSALHGEALLTVERARAAAADRSSPRGRSARDDIRTECAGVIAGAWFAIEERRGHELIAAGLLMLAGPTDLDELDRWIRVGWERRRGATSNFAFEDG